MINLKIIFKQQNPNFNKDYANQYHEGRESVDNYKELWSRGLIFFVKNYTTNKDIEYQFHGELDNGNKIDFNLKNMTVLKIEEPNGNIIEIVISKPLIKKIIENSNTKLNTSSIYFYFENRYDYTKIDDCMYLLNSDIPERIFKKI